MPPLDERLRLAERTMVALVADAELPPKIGVHPAAGRLVRPRDAGPPARRRAAAAGRPARDQVGRRLPGRTAALGPAGDPRRSWSSSDPATGVPGRDPRRGPITAQRTAAVSGVAIAPVRAARRGPAGAGRRSSGPASRATATWRSSAHVLPGVELAIFDRARRSGPTALADAARATTEGSARAAVAATGPRRGRRRRRRRHRGVVRAPAERQVDDRGLAGARRPRRRRRLRDVLSPRRSRARRRCSSSTSAGSSSRTATRASSTATRTRPRRSARRSSRAGRCPPAAASSSRHLGVGLADLVFGDAILRRARGQLGIWAWSLAAVTHARPRGGRRRDDGRLDGAARPAAGFDDDAPRRVRRRPPARDLRRRDPDHPLVARRDPLYARWSREARSAGSRSARRSARRCSCRPGCSGSPTRGRLRGALGGDAARTGHPGRAPRPGRGRRALAADAVRRPAFAAFEPEAGLLWRGAGSRPSRAGSRGGRPVRARRARPGASRRAPPARRRDRRRLAHAAGDRSCSPAGRGCRACSRSPRRPHPGHQAGRPVHRPAARRRPVPRGALPCWVDYDARVLRHPGDRRPRHQDRARPLRPGRSTRRRRTDRRPGDRSGWRAATCAALPGPGRRAGRRDPRLPVRDHARHALHHRPPSRLRQRLARRRRLGPRVQARPGDRELRRRAHRRRANRPRGRALPPRPRRVPRRACAPARDSMVAGWSGGAEPSPSPPSAKRRGAARPGTSSASSAVRPIQSTSSG